MPYIKIFFQGFEFRKEIKIIENNKIEGWISLNHIIIDNLLTLFREKNDRNVIYLENKYKVHIKFVHNSLKITNGDNYCKSIKDTIDEIIHIFEGDMTYLKSKNKLPPSRKSYNRPPPQPQSLPLLNIPESTQHIQPSPQVPYSTSVQEIEQGEIVSTPQPQQQQQSPPNIQHNNAANNVMPGLIVVIPNPTPKILAELFQNNINYTLIPEYILAQPQIPIMYPSHQQ
jgi:hypothetical protein